MYIQGIAGYRGSIPVAVKTLTSQDTTIIQKFLEEAELMKKFSHPNIVSILGNTLQCNNYIILYVILRTLLRTAGVCTDDVDNTSAPLMILEYMPFGDLQSFLESYR